TMAPPSTRVARASAAARAIDSPMERVPSMGCAVAISRSPLQARSDNSRFLWCAAPGGLAIEGVEDTLEAARRLLDPRGRGLAACGGFFCALGRNLRAGRGLVGRIVGRPRERVRDGKREEQDGHRAAHVRSLGGVTARVKFEGPGVTGSSSVTTLV